MSAENQENLVWLDLETTGFPDLATHGAHRHQILEIAAVVTDYSFNVLDSFQVVLGRDYKDTWLLCDEVVRVMHSDSGLFDEVFCSALTLEQGEAALLEFLRKNNVAPGSSPLCGSSITFDRMFIEAQMPELNAHLHYRQFDVSAVKIFLQTINPKLEPAKKKAHRAMDDVLESIAEARHYRDLLAPHLASF